MTTYVSTKQPVPPAAQEPETRRSNFNSWVMESSFSFSIPCSGRVTRENGMVEACGDCRVHELAWAPYYAEQLRLWLLKRGR